MCKMQAILMSNYYYYYYYYCGAYGREERRVQGFGSET